MATFGIDSVRSLPNFQTVYKWDLQFTQLPAVGPLAFPLSQGLNIRCESTTLPNTANQKIEIYQKGHKVFQNGINDYNSTIDLTFTETVDNYISKFIAAWQEMIWATRSGQSFSKASIEAGIIITRLNEADEPIWEYNLKGVFLETYDLGTLDSATSDVMRPNVTLSYDYFTQKPLK
jgi:hypothetical protein